MKCFCAIFPRGLVDDVCWFCCAIEINGERKYKALFTTRIKSQSGDDTVDDVESTLYRSTRHTALFDMRPKIGQPDDGLIVLSWLVGGFSRQHHVKEVKEGRSRLEKRWRTCARE